MWPRKCVKGHYQIHENMDIDMRIIILSDSVYVRVKNIFLQYGGKRNMFMYIPCTNHSRYVSMSIKALTQATCCQNCVIFCQEVIEIWPKM